MDNDRRYTFSGLKKMLQKTEDATRALEGDIELVEIKKIDRRKEEPQEEAQEVNAALNKVSESANTPNNLEFISGAFGSAIQSTNKLVSTAITLKATTSSKDDVMAIKKAGVDIYQGISDVLTAHYLQTSTALPSSKVLLAQNYHQKGSELVRVMRSTLQAGKPELSIGHEISRTQEALENGVLVTYSATDAKRPLLEGCIQDSKKQLVVFQGVVQKALGVQTKPNFQEIYLLIHKAIKQIDSDIKPSASQMLETHQALLIEYQQLPPPDVMNEQLTVSAERVGDSLAATTGYFLGVLKNVAESEAEYDELVKIILIVFAGVWAWNHLKPATGELQPHPQVEEPEELEEINEEVSSPIAQSSFDHESLELRQKYTIPKSETYEIQNFGEREMPRVKHYDTQKEAVSFKDYTEEEIKEGLGKKSIFQVDSEYQTRAYRNYLTKQEQEKLRTSSEATTEASSRASTPEEVMEEIDSPAVAMKKAGDEGVLTTAGPQAQVFEKTFMVTPEVLELMKRFWQEQLYNQASVRAVSQALSRELFLKPATDANDAIVRFERVVSEELKREYVPKVHRAGSREVLEGEGLRAAQSAAFRGAEKHVERVKARNARVAIQGTLKEHLEQRPTSAKSWDKHQQAYDTLRSNAISSYNDGLFDRKFFETNSKVWDKALSKAEKQAVLDTAILLPPLPNKRTYPKPIALKNLPDFIKKEKGRLDIARGYEHDENWKQLDEIEKEVKRQIEFLNDPRTTRKVFFDYLRLSAITLGTIALVGPGLAVGAAGVGLAVAAGAVGVGLVAVVVGLAVAAAVIAAPFVAVWFAASLISPQAKKAWNAMVDAAIAVGRTVSSATHAAGQAASLATKEGMIDTANISTWGNEDKFSEEMLSDLAAILLASSVHSKFYEKLSSERDVGGPEVYEDIFDRRLTQDEKKSIGFKREGWEQAIQDDFGKLETGLKTLSEAITNGVGDAKVTSLQELKTFHEENKQVVRQAYEKLTHFMYDNRKNLSGELFGRLKGVRDGLKANEIRAEQKISEVNQELKSLKPSLFEGFKQRFASSKEEGPVVQAEFEKRLREPGDNPTPANLAMGLKRIVDELKENFTKGSKEVPEYLVAVDSALQNHLSEAGGEREMSLTDFSKQIEEVKKALPAEDKSLEEIEQGVQQELDSHKPDGPDVSATSPTV